MLSGKKYDKQSLKDPNGGRNWFDNNKQAPIKMKKQQKIIEVPTQKPNKGGVREAPKMTQQQKAMQNNLAQQYGSYPTPVAQQEKSACCTIF